VPIEQTRSFTTVQDNQERVKIRVYQGESRRADENELLGQFEFSGFKKAPRGQVRIDVTFEINGDGIVNVTACERESGQQASTEILLSSGLSEQEIAKILAQRRTDRVQTAKVAPPAPARPEPARPAAEARPRPKPAAAPAPAAARTAAPPPPPPLAAESAAPLAGSDDDLDVLPDDDDLEAVLEEVGAAPEPVAPPPPAPPPAPRAAAPRAAAAAAAAAAPAARAPARRPEDDPLLDVAGAPPDDDLVGPLDVVQDVALDDAVEVEVAAPPAEFDGTLPSSESEIELDPSDLDGLDVDLGQAGEFSTGVDGGPMIGGNAEFSEGDFAGGAEEEDPNAKTQPEMDGETMSRSAAPAAQDVSEGLFGDAGADLSIFGDDEPVER